MEGDFLTCGKNRFSSLSIFDSVFYFSIKLPFHKFPLCQRLDRTRKMMEKKKYSTENSIWRNWFMLRFHFYEDDAMFFSARSRKIPTKCGVCVFCSPCSTVFAFKLICYITSLPSNNFLLIVQWMSLRRVALELSLHKYIINVMKTIP